MLETRTLEALPHLSRPVLSLYLNTNPADPRNQGHPPGYLTWLKSRAQAAADKVPQNEKKTWKEQLQRIEQYLRNEPPRQRSLVVFAGPGAWELIPLQVDVEEQLHWGHPHLTQLLWLVDEHKPCGIVTVDRGGARFFTFHLGEAHEQEEEKFHVDVSAWRPKDIVPPAHPGVQKVRGSQRDFYEQKMDEQFAHFYREVADRLRRWSERNTLRPLLLVGPPEAVDTVKSSLPKTLQGQTKTLHEDLGHCSASELQERVHPEVTRWRREREVTLVNDMFEAPRESRVVLGMTETLTALQEGRVRELVVGRELSGRLHRCENCGWVEDSADPTCRLCGSRREAIEVEAALPELARRHGAHVEVVAGEAENKLSQAGSIGAWLR